MADFPTSPHTFTPFANGALSDASQVTDIYSEVEAIETGYLTGTARLNSSNSTVANLSVAGGSTFAGAMTVTGTATLSSLVYAPAQPRCSVYSSAAQSFAAGAFTALTFESEQFDVGGLHSTATNPSRITIPAGSSGLYLVGAIVRVSTGGAGDEVVGRFIINSTTEQSAGPRLARASSAGISLHWSSPLVLDGGDFVQVEMQPVTSTGSLGSGAATARRGTSEFWCVKLW